MNHAISGEMLVKEVMFPRSEISFATLVYTMINFSMRKHLKAWLHQSLSQSVGISLLAELKLTKPYQTLHNCTQWCLLVPNGSLWHLMVANGCQWYPMVPNDNKWLSMIYQPSGARGTRSPPATPHRPIYPKWPPGSRQSWENKRAAWARSRNTECPPQEHSSPKITYNFPLHY